MSSRKAVASSPKSERDETDEILARSVPDNYQDLMIDVVIDPDRPGEVHFVNVNAQDFWKAVP